MISTATANTVEETAAAARDEYARAYKLQAPAGTYWDYMDDPAFLRYKDLAAIAEAAADADLAARFRAAKHLRSSEPRQAGNERAEV